MPSISLFTAKNPDIHINKKLGDDMLSIFKAGPAANKVPAEKVQETYGRYRIQALLSVFLGYLAYYIVRNNFTLSTPYLKEHLDLSAT